jgi:hypothetical protein
LGEQMTAEQKLWMQQHPEHKHWRPQGVVSIYGWTDVGWVFPNGKFAADGTLHLMAGSKALKVGREFVVC